MTISPAARAGIAARAVVARFGAAWRVGGVPLVGTHLARNAAPPTPTSEKLFNYWWQAHYVDALVDAARRECAEGNDDAADRARHIAGRVLRSVWLRNRGHWVNDFYDDMAWLALASDRLAELGGVPSPTAAWVRAALGPQFAIAHTADWGGGCYWSKAHDFKNAPASIPIALWYARRGETASAEAIADWVRARLVSRDTGLVVDGVREDVFFMPSEPAVWTYNQGTYLALLLALGRLDEAAALVGTIDEHLRVDGDVLRCEGAGDGGLFTGILGRYLALAARDPRLGADVRARCAAMVTATADALWVGRDVARTVFSPDPLRPAADSYSPGDPVGLTPQLQAWTLLEAAARVAVPDAR